MNKQNELKITEQLPEKNEKVERSRRPANKRPFVEPKISVPVDVLEATTNFLFNTADTTIVPSS